MKKAIFKNRAASCFAAAALGVLAGLAVAFFSRFPHNDLWSLAMFSSGTFGFWIATSSLIALFSEKPYTAGLCVALYVYFLFYVTGIFKCLALVRKGYAPISYFYHSFWEALSYGALPAVLCFALAFLLWYGRRPGLLFTSLRFAPLLFILAEAITLFIRVLTAREDLFMTIVDALCAAGYLVILMRNSDFEKRRPTVGDV